MKESKSIMETNEIFSLLTKYSRQFFVRVNFLPVLLAIFGFASTATCQEAPKKIGWLQTPYTNVLNASANLGHQAQLAVTHAKNKNKDKLPEVLKKYDEARKLALKKNKAAYDECVARINNNEVGKAASKEKYQVNLDDIKAKVKELKDTAGYDDATYGGGILAILTGSKKVIEYAKKAAIEIARVQQGKADASWPEIN
jgi:hypothetical protein